MLTVVISLWYIVDDFIFSLTYFCTLQIIYHVSNFSYRNMSYCNGCVYSAYVFPWITTEISLPFIFNRAEQWLSWCSGSGKNLENKWKLSYLACWKEPGLRIQRSVICSHLCDNSLYPSCYFYRAPKWGWKLFLRILPALTFYDSMKNFLQESPSYCCILETGW